MKQICRPYILTVSLAFLAIIWCSNGVMALGDNWELYFSDGTTKVNGTDICTETRCLSDALSSAMDYTYIQNYSVANCPAGQFLQGKLKDGTLNCSLVTGVGGNSTADIWAVLTNGSFYHQSEILAIITNGTFDNTDTDTWNSTADIWAIIDNGTLDLDGDAVGGGGAGLWALYNDIIAINETYTSGINNVRVNGSLTAVGEINESLLYEYENVRIGTDGHLSGKILFEYDGLGVNTVWQIDNGGDSLRFFNDSYVFVRINKSGLFVPSGKDICIAGGNCVSDTSTGGAGNCSVDGSCEDIIYDSELNYTIWYFISNGTLDLDGDADTNTWNSTADIWAVITNGSFFHQSEITALILNVNSTIDTKISTTDSNTNDANQNATIALKATIAELKNGTYTADKWNSTIDIWAVLTNGSFYHQSEILAIITNGTFDNTDTNTWNNTQDIWNVITNDSFYHQSEILSILTNGTLQLNITNQTCNSSAAFGAWDNGIFTCQPVSSVAGNTTDVQFNNAGSLGGSDDFRFDDTTNILNVTGKIAEEGQLLEEQYEPKSTSGETVFRFVNNKFQIKVT